MLSKLYCAKRCVAAILAQLTERDELGIVLFNHEPHRMQPMGPCTKAFKAAVLRKLKAVRPGGGTRLLDGFMAGMDALVAGSARSGARLRRVYFLTDMLSSPGDESAVLGHAHLRAEAQGLHSTVVGVGVDLSVRGFGASCLSPCIAVSCDGALNSARARPPRRLERWSD